MNTPKEFLEDLNACASDALEALDGHDLDKCRTDLKALLDAIREELEAVDDAP